MQLVILFLRISLVSSLMNLKHHLRSHFQFKLSLKIVVYRHIGTVT